MKKIMKGIAAALAVVFMVPFMISAAEPSPESVGSKGISPISGTFIQPWLYNSFSDARWDKEIEFWKKLGIEYIIVGDTALVNIDNDYSIRADYPTQIEGATRGTDSITKIMQKCSENDIKVFLGVGNTTSNTGIGWGFLDFTKDENVKIIKELGEVFGMIAEDLHNVYYDDYKDTFAGYYFVPELYNSNHFDSPSSREVYVNGLAAGMDIMFDKISELEGDLPLALSPYVNIFGGSWVTKSPENHSAFWKELLETAHFRDGDILVPQDGVGANGMDLENLATWTKAYRDAVDGCGKQIQFWSNCEIFMQPKEEKNLWPTDGVNYWASATMDRMVEQFKIVAPYVDRIITFAAPHYLSPYNAAPGYYESYLQYLETGELEKEKPTPPDKFKTIISTVEDKSVLTVYWSGMYDDVGIHRVNIYKNGEFFTYRVTGRLEQQKPNIYPNNFYDDEFDLEEDSATYEFEVIDCAGNISERSSFTVEKGNIPNGVSLDKAYTGPKKSDDENSKPKDESDESIKSDESDGKVTPKQNNKATIVAILATSVIAVAAIAFFAGKAIINKKKK